MAVNASATLESQDVGLIFVREYYTFLNKKPNRLHAFYNKDSLFVRGDEGTVTTTVQGQEEIRKKIEECHFEDCKVLVTQVDSQVSANNGILIQVLGEMCNQNGPSQKFSQTFFLATQPNGYFVLNDIFRFLKDEVEIDYYTCEQEQKEESVVIDIAPSPVPSSPVVEVEVKKEEVKKLEVKEPEVKEAEVPEVKEPEVKEVEKIEKIEPEVKKVETVKEEVVEEKKKKTETKVQQQKKEQKKENKIATKTWANLAATNGTATPEKSNVTPSSPVVSHEKTFNSVPTPSSQPQPQQQQQQNKNQPSRNNSKEATHIFVKLVTENITEDQLQEAFNKIGPVKSCSINRPKNCGFIEFHSPESCSKALAQHKVLVGNNTVHAEERRFNQANSNRYNNQRTQNSQQQTYDRRTNNTNTRRGGGTTQSRINQGKGRGVPTNTK